MTTGSPGLGPSQPRFQQPVVTPPGRPGLSFQRLQLNFPCSGLYELDPAQTQFSRHLSILRPPTASLPPAKLPRWTVQTPHWPGQCWHDRVRGAQDRNPTGHASEGRITITFVHQRYHHQHGSIQTWSIGIWVLPGQDSDYWFPLILHHVVIYLFPSCNPSWVW